MSASALFLLSSRLTSGLTQRTIAERAQTSTPALSFIENGRREPSAATLDGLLRATGNRLGVVPTRRPGSLEAGAAIYDELQSGDSKAAFRSFLQFSDDLAAESGVIRVVLTANEPRATGAPLWDTALAAVAEFWLNKQRLPLPDWTNAPRRHLTELTVLAGDTFTRSIEKNRVPVEFARRNIAMDRAVLASV